MHSDKNPLNDVRSSCRTSDPTSQQEIQINRRSLIFAALTLVPALQGLTAWAHDAKVGDLTISHPWARASLSAKVRNGASYLTLHNSGSNTDRLIGASTHIADRAQLHTHEMKGDVMKMRRVEVVEIPAGGTVEFKPAGFHIMLMGLRTPLRKGRSFPMTLKFEMAGEVDVEVIIESGTAGSGGMGHGGHMKQDNDGSVDHGKHMKK